MTRSQLRKKFRELKKENNKCLDILLERAIKSGALNVQCSEDNYMLPKIIMHACCKELSFQWRPLTDAGRREAKNLALFL